MSFHPVFVSYRVDDTSAEAREIYSKLNGRFPNAVFLDDSPQGIANGENFEDRIGAEIDGCEVVLVVIGPAWATLKDGSGVRRICDPHDYVRFEISRALALGKLVIPVYVRGAAWLKKRDLPADLDGLRKLNARILPPRREGFEDGLIHLAERIKVVLEPSGEAKLLAFANFVLITVAGFLFGYWSASATQIGRELSAALTVPLATLLAGVWKWSGDLFKRDDWQQRVQSIFSSVRTLLVSIVLLSGVLLTVLRSQVVEITSPEPVRYNVTVSGTPTVSDELSASGKSEFFVWWPSAGRTLTVRDDKGRDFCAGPVKRLLWERVSYRFVPVKGGLDLILCPSPAMFDRCSQHSGTVTVHVTTEADAATKMFTEVVPVEQRSYHCECIRISSSEETSLPNGFHPGGFEGFVNDRLPFQRPVMEIGASLMPSACGRQPRLIVTYAVELDGGPVMRGSKTVHAESSSFVEMHP